MRSLALVLLSSSLAFFAVLAVTVLLTLAYNPAHSYLPVIPAGRDDHVCPPPLDPRHLVPPRIREGVHCAAGHGTYRQGVELVACRLLAAYLPLTCRLRAAYLPFILLRLLMSRVGFTRTGHA